MLLAVHGLCGEVSRTRVECNWAVGNEEPSWFWALSSKIALHYCFEADIWKPLEETSDGGGPDAGGTWVLELVGLLWMLTHRELSVEPHIPEHTQTESHETVTAPNLVGLRQ